MRITFWEDNKPKQATVQQLVVFDDQGNPLGVFWNLTANAVEFACLGHDDFTLLLEKLGVADIEVREIKSNADNNR